MIRYALTCACGHGFDAWFGSIAGFDEQSRRREIGCPACGGHEVAKAIMAPRIASGATAGARPRCATLDAPASPPAEAERDTMPPAAPDDAHAARDVLLAAARKLRQAVRENADYVGPRFAAEARRIDEGDAPERGIYGEATPQEARALIEDGIAVLPLPRLPEEQN